MTDKILFIDDDVNLLSGIKRQFRNRFKITTAAGGEKAIEAVNEHGPFAVVICDMRMPGMDGLEVLATLMKISPDTVRIMLTGNADQQTAINAVNEGNILRFYNKPCPPEQLADGIEAGIKQYGLVIAEKELLANTLAGSVKVLVDVLSVVDEESFGKASRVREWVRLLTKPLNLSQSWILEMAAMLSGIGWVAIPPGLREKAKSGVSLSTLEKEIVSEVPETGKKWIENIPRLKVVANIVYYQNKGFDGSGFPNDGVAGDEIPLEARVLKLLYDLCEVTTEVNPGKESFNILKQKALLYDPAIFAMAKKHLPSEKKETGEDVHFQAAEIPLSMLIAGYELLEDIKTVEGKLILAKNQQISNALLVKLRNIDRIHKIQQPILVQKRVIAQD